MMATWKHTPGLSHELRAAFDRADFAEIIRLMDQHFGKVHYTLRNLFRDEQTQAC